MLRSENLFIDLASGIAVVKFTAGQVTQNYDGREGPPKIFRLPEKNDSLKFCRKKDDSLKFCKEKDDSMKFCGEKKMTVKFCK